MCQVTVVFVTAWNLYAVRYLAPQMFPNFPHARAAVLVGDSLGHSWVRLLLPPPPLPLPQPSVKWAAAASTAATTALRHRSAPSSMAQSRRLARLETLLLARF